MALLLVAAITKRGRVVLWRAAVAASNYEACAWRDQASSKLGTAQLALPLKYLMNERHRD